MDLFCITVHLTQSMLKLVAFGLILKMLKSLKLSLTISITDLFVCLFFMKEAIGGSI